MPRCCLTMPVATLVVALTACSVQTPYPADWPRSIAPAAGQCPALSGTFENYGDWAIGGDRDPRLLAALFFPLAARDRLDRHLERRAVTALSFEDSGGSTVRVRAWLGQEVLFERTLTEPELGCVDGRLVLRDSGLAVEGSIMAAGWTAATYLLSTGEDGSLLLEQRDAGAAVVVGVVPMASRSQSWLRFQPAETGHAPDDWPRGLRGVPAASQQLLLPAGAKKWSGYEAAQECVRIARSRSATPADADGARLAGRPTQPFLTGVREGGLAPSGNAHRTMGWVPATHDLRVEKLYWGPQATADHYVLCLLDKGFRWEPQ